MDHFQNPKDDPFILFQDWNSHAAKISEENASFLSELKSKIQEGAYSAFGLSNAVTLATSSKAGVPSCRVVLFKELNSENELVFYTNYESQKSQDLLENPLAALGFYWPLPIRQIRVSGSVRKTSREESEKYWNSRPRGSQIAGSISNQSQEIKDRGELKTRFDQFDKEYASKPIPCPENWGGWAINATQIEFWQGRLNRLHDRLLYSKNPDDSWTWTRLSP